MTLLAFLLREAAVMFGDGRDAGGEACDAVAPCMAAMAAQSRRRAPFLSGQFYNNCNLPLDSITLVEVTPNERYYPEQKVGDVEL